MSKQDFKARLEIVAEVGRAEESISKLSGQIAKMW
jgi:hypothetical protein